MYIFFYIYSCYALHCIAPAYELCNALYCMPLHCMWSVYLFLFFFLWLFYLVGIWPSIYRQLPGCQANNYFFQNISKTNPWNKFIIMKQNYSFSVNTNYWNINWNMELKHKLKHKLKHRLKHKFKTQFKTRFVISNVRRSSWISV